MKRIRPSAGRKFIDVRWRRDKWGAWRLQTEEINEVEFCYRATHEQRGFHKGARIAGRFKSAFFETAWTATPVSAPVDSGGDRLLQANA